MTDLDGQSYRDGRYARRMSSVFIIRRIVERSRHMRIV